MPTALQDWLHGTQRKVSSTRIDTQKNIGPKLAGREANDALEVKGIVDNAARVAGTAGTMLANRYAGTDIPVSGDYYDSIRWLLNGASGDLPPYLIGKDSPPAPPTLASWADETDYEGLAHLTEREIGENNENVTYNNFSSPNFASGILALIASPYTDSMIDDGGRYLKGNQLLSFNRYLAFKMVTGITPDDPKQYKDRHAKLSDGWTPIGTRSLFNNWRIVSVNQANRQPFFDTPKTRKKTLEMYKCDTDTLVQETRKGNMGRETFQYSDFMFCSHAGEVSNEHMITLRKFNTPCQDNILINVDKDYNVKNKFNKPAVGTMITWLGVSGNTLDGLMTFNYNQNSKDCKLDEEKDDGNENGGILGKVSAMMDKNRANLALKGGPSAFAGGPWDGAIGAIPGDVKGNRDQVSAFHASKNENSIWRNNRVVRPKKMESFGIEYKHSICVNFEYDLMSFGGVNGRQAFLDLLSNILITTSNECSFYGMAYRTTGVEPNQLLEDLYKGISGSKSFGENFSTLANNIMGRIRSFFSGDPKEAAKTILNNLGNSVLGQLMNKLGRNAFIGMNSNFTDSPLGNWHLTIGNPRHPIVTIGNLWLTDTKLSFDGPLNIDGFPSKIKVTCTLEECADRDPIRIERMFQDGVGRIYHHASREQLTNMYTRKGKEVKKVSVSQKKRNNQTNQTEYEHSIDGKDNANQPVNTTIAKSQQSIETGICDLGCTGGDKPTMIDLS